MNVASIRDGLLTALDTVAGLRCYDTIPEDIVVPAAVVVPDDPFTEYAIVVNRGTVTLHFRITLVVSKTSMRAGQDLLDGYLSTGSAETSSVVDALYADATLGGSASTLVVVEGVEYGSTVIGSVEYLKADLRVTVQATR